MDDEQLRMLQDLEKQIPFTSSVAAYVKRIEAEVEEDFAAKYQFETEGSDKPPPLTAPLPPKPSPSSTSASVDRLQGGGKGIRKVKKALPIASSSVTRSTRSATATVLTSSSSLSSSFPPPPTAPPPPKPSSSSTSASPDLVCTPVTSTSGSSKRQLPAGGEVVRKWNKARSGPVPRSTRTATDSSSSSPSTSIPPTADSFEDLKDELALLSNKAARDRSHNSRGVVSTQEHYWKVWCAMERILAKDPLLYFSAVIEMLPANLTLIPSTDDEHYSVAYLRARYNHVSNMLADSGALYSFDKAFDQDILDLFQKYPLNPCSMVLDPRSKSKVMVRKDVLYRAEAAAAERVTSQIELLKTVHTSLPSETPPSEIFYLSCALAPYFRRMLADKEYRKGYLNLGTNIIKELNKVALKKKVGRLYDLGERPSSTSPLSLAASIPYTGMTVEENCGRFETHRNLINGAGHRREAYHRLLAESVAGGREVYNHSLLSYADLSPGSVHAAEAFSIAFMQTLPHNCNSQHGNYSLAGAHGNAIFQLVSGKHEELKRIGAAMFIHYAQQWAENYDQMEPLVPAKESEQIIASV